MLKPVKESMNNKRMKKIISEIKFRKVDIVKICSILKVC